MSNNLYNGYIKKIRKNMDTYIGKKVKVHYYNGNYTICYLIRFYIKPNYNTYDSRNNTFIFKKNLNDIAIISIVENIIKKIEVLDENLKSLYNFKVISKNRIINNDVSSYIDKFFY